MSKPQKEGNSISRKQYLKHSENEWRGVRVKNLTELRNGLVSIPAGSELTIYAKQSGFRVEGSLCPCCQVRPVISKVEPNLLSIID